MRSGVEHPGLEVRSKKNRMQIKTILNRVQKFKSFVYGTVHWVEGASVPTLEVEIQPRLNSRPVCSSGRKRPGYDTLPARRFELTRAKNYPRIFLTRHN